MKKSKTRTLNVIGCILGIVVIIAGIYFMVSPADSYSTSSVKSASFGADFYTYVYDGVATAVSNTAVTANNLRELSGKLALYSGFLFLVLGALIEIHFCKLLFQETESEKRDVSDAPSDGSPITPEPPAPQEYSDGPAA